MMAVVFEGRRIGWMHGAVFLHRPGLHVFTARSLYSTPGIVNHADWRAEETTCPSKSMLLAPGVSCTMRIHPP
jgi:hypothetical protein